MYKNVTLKLQANILEKAKHEAIETHQSLSQWLTDLIKKTVTRKSRQSESKKIALKYLKQGFNLGGKPLPREEIYADL